MADALEGTVPAEAQDATAAALEGTMPAEAQDATAALAPGLLPAAQSESLDATDATAALAQGLEAAVDLQDAAASPTQGSVTAADPQGDTSDATQRFVSTTSAPVPSADSRGATLAPSQGSATAASPGAMMADVTVHPQYIDISRWRQWTGKEVAQFLTTACDLPQYSGTAERNLTGAVLATLFREKLMGKGLARAGICDHRHQQKVIAAIGRLERGHNFADEELRTPNAATMLRRGTVGYSSRNLEGIKLYKRPSLFAQTALTVVDMQDAKGLPQTVTRSLMTKSASASTLSSRYSSAGDRASPVFFGQ